MSQNKNRKSLYEIIFTVAIPVVLLNKLSSQFEQNGPLIALIVALSFPVGYFLFDFIKTRHISGISILGFVNILLTGGFALFQLNSTWFAIKEMSIPLAIAIAVGISAFTKKPLISMILHNKDIIDTDLIEQKLDELNSREQYQIELKTLTLYFAVTFLVSAALNYILAINIVTELPTELTETAKMQMRNEQIADMTWKSYIVILIPSFAMMGFVLYKANNVLKKCTTLSLEEIVRK